MSRADGVGHAAPGEQSTGELVKQVAEQVSVLVRDELKLARLEMTHKGRHWTVPPDTFAAFRGLAVRAARR